MAKGRGLLPIVIFEKSSLLWYCIYMTMGACDETGVWDRNLPSKLFIRDLGL